MQSGQRAAKFKSARLAEVRHLLAGSHGFLKAADLLVNASGQLHFPVFCVNLSFAFELSLKGYILASGGTDAEIKTIGHDLLAAFVRATGQGYVPLLAGIRDLIATLALSHTDSSARYLLGPNLTVPDPKGSIVIARIHVETISRYTLALTQPTP